MLANYAAMCISGYERLTKRLVSTLRQPFEAFEGKEKHFKGNCCRLEGVERLESLSITTSSTIRIFILEINPKSS